jgi:hypothetical protein
MIFQLCYTSTAAREMERDDLVEVLRISRAKNKALGITGLLLYSGNRFVQLLEGDETAVRETYRRIVEDGRHEGLELVFEQEVEERECPNWSMGFQALQDTEWLEFPTPDGSEPGLRPMMEAMGRAKAMLQAVRERGLDPAKGL